MGLPGTSTQQRKRGRCLEYKLPSSQGEAAFTGCGPGQYPSWFETCPRDVVIPVVDTRAITGQRHVPSCSPNMEEMRVTSAIAMVRTWNNAISPVKHMTQNCIMRVYFQGGVHLYLLKDRWASLFHTRIYLLYNNIKVDYKKQAVGSVRKPSRYRHLSLHLVAWVQSLGPLWWKKRSRCKRWLQPPHLHCNTRIPQTMNTNEQTRRIWKN